MRVIIDKQLEAFTLSDLAYRAADILSWFNQSIISFSKLYIYIAHIKHRAVKHVIKDFYGFAVNILSLKFI